MWQIWIVLYVEGCGVKVRCSFSECVESFVLCIVGKMAQDVGMV